MTEIITRAKGVMDGAATLPEAAGRLRERADELDRLHAEGYRLEGPVEDDYGHVLAPGEEPGVEDEEESAPEGRFVNISYPVDGQFGVNDGHERTLERFAGTVGAEIADSGSGMGRRDLGFETSTKDQAEALSRAVRDAIPGATVTRTLYLWSDEDEEESGDAGVSGEVGVFTYFPPESGMDDRAAMDNGIVG